MSGSLSRRPKVLVTGGAGFIGRWLADRLALRYEVVIYDLTQPRIDRPGQSHIEGDVRDLDRLKWAMTGCDAVFHLAALVGVSECQAQEERMNAINVGGTSMVAAAVRATPTVKSVLAVSSSEVYGEGTGRLLDEDSPLKPITAYGVSKLGLEEIMSQLQSMSRRVTVIRPFNAYGPHQCSSFVVARFCQLAHRGESLPIVGTGTQTRAFTFVSDIVRGMMSAFDYGLHRRGGYDVFNLASRQSSSILHLARLVGELAASPGTTTLEYTPAEALGRSSQQEIQHRRASIEKAARLLGFEPSVDLREGLDRTMTWYRETSADGTLRPGAVSSPGPWAVSSPGAAAGRTAVG